jgi:hypothetical protein
MTADRLALVLPLPDAGLSPNRAKRGRTVGARQHTRRLARTYRHQVQLLTLEATGNARPMWPGAVLWPFWFMPDRRRRDRDNAAASFKAGLDGIVDAGLLEDDRHTLPMPIRWALDRDRPRVVLVVEHAEPSSLPTAYLPADVRGGADDG